MNDFVQLPQRPPRQRGRASKTKALDEADGQAAADVVVAEPPAALAADPPLATEPSEQADQQQHAAAGQQTTAEEQPDLERALKRKRGDGQAAAEAVVAEPPAAQAAGPPPFATDLSEQAVQQQHAAAGQQTTAEEQLELTEYRSAAEGGHKFEYLDHTADVQLHAWGTTLAEAIANVGLAMFNYMTPLEGIRIDSTQSRRYEAEGHDLQSLLFNFLDELLFSFSTDFFVAKELTISTIDRNDSWRIVAEGKGEHFDRERHASGTEVKAITYSAMQINERLGDAEVFVIVDI
ncbi:Protein archease-like [Chlorella vulgaris]